LPQADEPTKANVRMAEILDSAAKFFYTKGYHATSIEDVARDVGMLKGSLYYYIKSKEDLLYGLLLGVIKQGTGGVEKALEDAMLGMCNWIYRWYHQEKSPKLEVVKKTFVGLIKGGIVKPGR
jgi:AcrR family transcriptional regulator